MIEVVLPVTDILLLSLVADKFAKAVSLVILPVTLVNVAVRAPQLPLAVCLIIKPLTFVLCLVLPNLDSVSTLAALFIDVTRVKSVLHNL